MVAGAGHAGYADPAAAATSSVSTASRCWCVIEQTEMLDPTNIEGDKGGQMVTSMYGDMTVFFVD